MPGDRIELRGIRVWAHHGLQPHEREVGQPFVADVLVLLDLAPAGASDDLDDTIDYGALAACVHERLTTPRRDLVEAVADGLARAVLAHDARIRAVEVTVHKPHAPVTVPVDDVAITIRRIRK